MRVEVVCHANICRSPVAAALLEKATGVPVHSSGLEATPGQPADVRMVELLGRELPSMQTHRSRRFAAAGQENPDLILVMERSHRLRLIDLVPQLAGRTMLFGHWLDGTNEIADPFGLGDDEYAVTVARLRKAATAWGERLSRIW